MNSSLCSVATTSSTGSTRCWRAVARGTAALLWLHGDAGIGKTRVLAEVAARADGCTRAARHRAGRTPARRRSGCGRRWCGPRPAYVRLSSGAIARGWRCRCWRGRAGHRSTYRGGSRCSTRWTGCSTTWPASGPSYSCWTTCTGSTRDSLRLLQFLTTDLSERARLRRVRLARPRRRRQPPSRRELAAQVATRGESWLLRGLPADDVRALITATTGRDPGEVETRAVTERTGGNPLFVSEMARLAASRGVGLGRDRAARVGPGHHPSSGGPARPTGRGRTRRRSGAGGVVVGDPAGLPCSVRRPWSWPGWSTTWSTPVW